MSIIVEKYTKLIWPIIEGYLLSSRDSYDSMEVLDEISNTMKTSITNSNRKRQEPIFDVYYYYYLNSIMNYSK